MSQTAGLHVDFLHWLHCCASQPLTDLKKIKPFNHTERVFHVHRKKCLDASMRIFYQVKIPDVCCFLSFYVEHLCVLYRYGDKASALKAQSSMG